jgi:hypothetical protein
MQDAENKCGRFRILFCFCQWSFQGMAGGEGVGGDATYLEKEVSVLRASMAPWVACRTSFRFRS